MNTEFLSNRKYVLAFCFAWLALCVFFASFYTQQQRSTYVASLQSSIDTQREKLVSISELLLQNKADAEVQALVTDCSIENRVNFDKSLSELSLLKGQQLVEMEHLFNACGDFFALQQALMQSKFKRELEIFAMHVALLDATVASYNTYESEQFEWSKLMKLESERTRLSLELVRIQGEIIRALKDKITISSDDMQTKLVEGQKTKAELDSITAQILQQHTIMFAS